MDASCNSSKIYPYLRSKRFSALWIGFVIKNKNQTEGHERKPVKSFIQIELNYEFNELINGFRVYFSNASLFSRSLFEFQLYNQQSSTPKYFQSI